MSRYHRVCLVCPQHDIFHPPFQTIQTNDETNDMRAHAVAVHGLTAEMLDRATPQNYPPPHSYITQFTVWYLESGGAWMRLEAYDEHLHGLVQRGWLVGYQVKQLLARLDLSTDLLAKLEARAITKESLPTQLLARLADVLEVSPDELSAFFERPPEDGPFRCGPGQRLGKEPFSAAVKESPKLSSVQRAAWLALLEAERKS